MAWNSGTFPYLTLARITFLPTQMASPVHTVGASGWASHGPSAQRAKLRTPAGPQAKRCAVYCPQPRCLIPDLPTAENSLPPRHIHPAVRNTLPPPHWRLPCLHSSQGQWCYLPPLGGWRPGHPHGLSETQTPVRTGSGVSISARLRGSAQALLPPVAGRRAPDGEKWPGGVSWSGSGGPAPMPSARGFILFFIFNFKNTSRFNDRQG